MLYIWDENAEFFDSLPNKSKLINLFIQEKRKEAGDVVDKGEEFQKLVERFDARVKPNRETTKATTRDS